MALRVRLDWYEVEMAYDVARRRHASSLRNGHKHKFPVKTAQVSYQLYGALGEVAVAKALNIFWNGGVDTFHAPDVGPLHVRFTERLDGKLIIRPADPDDGVFVLVRGGGESPEFEFEIAGCMRANAAKCDRYLHPGYPPCYMVPAIALRPIEVLVRIINSKRES